MKNSQRFVIWPVVKRRDEWLRTTVKIQKSEHSTRLLRKSPWKSEVLDLRQIQTPTSESWRKSWRKKKGYGSSGCLIFMVIQVGVELCLFFSTRSRTDGSSSSCEMIILRNKSHGGIIRVCMGIFTAALRNKKIQSNSHTPSLGTRGSKTIYWCQVTVCYSARHSLQRRQG